MHNEIGILATRLNSRMASLKPQELGMVSFITNLSLSIVLLLAVSICMPDIAKAAEPTTPGNWVPVTNQPSSMKGGTGLLYFSQMAVFCLKIPMYLRQYILLYLIMIFGA